VAFRVLKKRRRFRTVDGPAIREEAVGFRRRIVLRPIPIPNGEFGDRLLGYLTGGEKLPLPFRARRGARGFGKPPARFISRISHVCGQNISTSGGPECAP